MADCRSGPLLIRQGAGYGPFIAASELTATGEPITTHAKDRITQVRDTKNSLG